MTRPSIFRCFLFLYRSLNFPAKKKNKLPASHEEAPLLRHSKSVVVVVVVVLMLLLLLLLPLLLLLACLHVGGDVDPSHLLARVCVCVCVCVFWLRFFFCSHPPAGGDQWPSDFLPQSAPSSPSSAKTRHPPVSRTTRETKDGETRAARRSGAINGRRRARQQQQQQQQQQQHGRTSKRKRFETILRLFSAASRNSARAIPPPPSLLSLSLSLSLFFRVCVFTSKNSFWDVSHRCHRRPSSATLRPPRWQSVRTSTVGRR